MSEFSRVEVVGFRDGLAEIYAWRRFLKIFPFVAYSDFYRLLTERMNGMVNAEVCALIDASYPTDDIDLMSWARLEFRLLA